MPTMTHLSNQLPLKSDEERLCRVVFDEVGKFLLTTNCDLSFTKVLYFCYQGKFSDYSHFFKVQNI